MSKYFDALRRAQGGESKVAAARGRTTRELSVEPFYAPPPKLAPVPAVHIVPARLSRAHPLHLITERVAPAATVGHPVRILVGGCRPGDGASSVAVALAVDLSQRLGMRTLLVDAHLRHPTLRQLIGQESDGSISADARRGPFGLRTGLARLDLATCAASAPERLAEIANELAPLLEGYPVAIVDLGVVRLDPAPLGLAREEDTIVLVARYGHTGRVDLATTVRALSAANRAVAGVILNSKRNPVPRFIRKLIGTGGNSEA